MDTGNNIEKEAIQENQEPEKGRIKKYLFFVLELVKIAIIAFVIVAPIRYFLFQPFIVSGASMSPNFASGDYLIIDEISYRFSEPRRGDIIVFNAGFIPGYSGQRFIKRIVGLPGETVDISNGQVQIIKDGQKNILNESYLSDDLKTYGEIKISLKGDEYFVLGDNREYSYDSRAWGVVTKPEIIGKALLRIFPITNLSEISRPSY